MLRLVLNFKKSKYGLSTIRAWDYPNKCRCVDTKAMLAELILNHTCKKSAGKGDLTDFLSVSLAGGFLLSAAFQVDLNRKGRTG